MVYEYISVSTYNQGWDVLDLSFTLQPDVYSFCCCSCLSSLLLLLFVVVVDVVVVLECFFS